ncbi:MAG: hypothetical protein AAGA78_00525 [Pseudomonadota bacterium]
MIEIEITRWHWSEPFGPPERPTSIGVEVDVKAVESGDSATFALTVYTLDGVAEAVERYGVCWPHGYGFCPTLDRDVIAHEITQSITRVSKAPDWTSFCTWLSRAIPQLDPAHQVSPASAKSSRAVKRNQLGLNILGLPSAEAQTEASNTWIKAEIRDLVWDLPLEVCMKDTSRSVQFTIAKSDERYGDLFTLGVTSPWGFDVHYRECLREQPGFLFLPEQYTMFSVSLDKDAILLGLHGLVAHCARTPDWITLCQGLGKHLEWVDERSFEDWGDELNHRRAQNKQS